MMKPFIISIFLLFSAIPAYPEQMSPEDFAYGLPLTVNGESPMYRVMLPQSVYLHVSRADIGDMRVFNKQGEIVPHILRSSEDLRTQTPEPVSLPFFPIYAESGSGSFAFQLSADGKGSILSIRTNSGEHPGGDISAYILDISMADRPIHELDLKWESNSESFVTTVSLDASNDLTHWQSIIAAATLTKLRYGEHQLEQNRIALPDRKARYLRLSWSAGKQGARLYSVKAEFSPMISEPDRNRMMLEGASVKAGYEFDTQGLFPTDRINVILPQKNSIARITLKSRANSNSEWKIRHRGVFHNLSVQGTMLKNTPVLLNPVITDRYWRIESDDSGGMGTGIPQLEIAWIPHELVFLARGDAPFQLAYGSARIGSSQSGTGRLFDNISQQEQYELVKQAIPGQETELSGSDMLKPLPPPFPWKTFLLWTILTAGVGILAWMAWRLYQQMNKESDRKDIS